MPVRPRRRCHLRGGLACGGPAGQSQRRSRPTSDTNVTASAITSVVDRKHPAAIAERAASPIVRPATLEVSSSSSFRRAARDASCEAESSSFIRMVSSSNAAYAPKRRPRTSSRVATMSSSSSKACRRIDSTVDVGVAGSSNWALFQRIVSVLLDCRLGSIGDEVCPGRTRDQRGTVAYLRAGTRPEMLTRDVRSIAHAGGSNGVSAMLNVADLMEAPAADAPAASGAVASRSSRRSRSRPACATPLA